VHIISDWKKETHSVSETGVVSILRLKERGRTYYGGPLQGLSAVTGPADGDRYIS